MTLEQLASEAGVWASDHLTPCSGRIPNDLDRVGASKPSVDGDRCVIRVFGFYWMDSASFALYIYSLSVVLQALVVISMSGAADHGSHRKQFLLGFALLGSLSTILFVAVRTGGIGLAGFCAVLANICYGASLVCLNAFLPILVQNHPLVRGAVSENQADFEYANSVALQLSTKISSQGIAVGYSSGVLLQSLCIPLILWTGSTTASLQYAIMVSGIWWLVFTLPASKFIQPRPGPPMSPHGSLSNARLVWTYISYGWTVLYRSIRQVRKLRDVLLFLVAWFLMSDGYTIITSTAILFAKTTLYIKPAGLAAIGILSTLFGIIGAFTWPRVIARYFNLSSRQVILVILAMSLAVPLYGLSGFLSFVRDLQLGLTQPAEVYVLACYFGFLYGGLQGYARSVFSQLIPPGVETGFFALYAVTDKNSSAFGTFLSGVIISAAGNVRAAFGLILVMLASAVFVFWFVDLSRGRLAALSQPLEAASSVEGAVDRSESQGLIEPSDSDA